MLIEVKIKGVALDPLTNVPIVLLKGGQESQTLPIWIGFFEANSIVSQIEQIASSRPLTHDLLKNMLDCLDSKVERIIISELMDNTFYAVIEISHKGKVFKLDSRPSDAIALALRVQSPLFVEEDVFKKAKKIDLSKESGPSEDKWKEWLEKTHPEDFGKYRM